MTKTKKKDIATNEGVIFVYEGIGYKEGDSIPYSAWKNVLATHQMALAMNHEEFKDIDAEVKKLDIEVKKTEPELRAELEELRSRLAYVVKSVYAFALSLDKAIKL